MRIRDEKYNQTDDPRYQDDGTPSPASIGGLYSTKSAADAGVVLLIT